MSVRRPLPQEPQVAVRATSLQVRAANRRRVAATAPLNWDTVDFEGSVLDGILMEVEPLATANAAEVLLAGGDSDRPARHAMDLRLPASFLTE